MLEYPGIETNVKSLERSSLTVRFKMSLNMFSFFLKMFIFSGA